MPRSFTLLVGLALLASAACATDDESAAGPRAAPAHGDPAVSSSAHASSAGPASDAAVDPDAAPVSVAGLTRRALAVAQRGDPIAAVELLLATLRDAARGGLAASDEQAECEVACALLDALVSQTATQSLVLAERDAHGPFAGRLPRQAAFRLERQGAEALLLAGRVDEAAALTRAAGYLTDFIAIGPFDNERGSGFDVAQPPEQAFDRDRPVRGKERDVVWRGLPASHPLGVLEPGLMFEPDEQVTSFFATALVLEDDVEVVLGASSACALKVTLDGSVVLARKVERPLHPDQDRVPLFLSAGVHPLLVELAVEDGPYLAALRLTTPDGLPVPGLRVDPERLDEPSAASSRLAADGSPVPDAPALLARADVGDADAALLATLWQLTVHPDDESARSARLAAEHFVALAPDDALAYYLLAQALDPRGASREEIAVDDRLAALRRCVELDPGCVSALLELADFALDESPRPERADELTARALSLAPDSWRALRTRARHLAERDRDAEASELRDLALATRDASFQPGARAEAAARLLRRGDEQGSLALLRAAFETRVADDPVFDALLGRLTDMGDLDEALAVVRRLLSTMPLSLAVRVDSGRLLEFAGAPDDARVLYEEALEVCPEWTSPLRELLRLEERAGDGLAARALLDEILRLDPGDDAARRHRALLQPEQRDAFEAPYRWDAQALVDVPRPVGDGNDPVELLRRTTVHRLHPDGTEHTYEHLAFRALTSGGVKQLDTYGIFVPQGASLQVFAVRVVRPDGSTERAPPRGGRGSRSFDLPPLTIGDVVDVEYRVDESEPDVFGRYFGTRHTFHPDTVDGMAPTRLSELVILAPQEVPLYIAERNADDLDRSVRELDTGLTEYRWVARDLPRPTLQSSMPELVEIGPVVDLTTYESWDAFARWWWSFIEKEFVTTPAMRAKVAELTAGLSTEREKVEAINKFVAQEIRYNSWPFGTHGYEPFSAATIFERRFGDCKDKSILLRQLLAEIGVEAIPVLINARYRQPDEPLAAAMVGQFNHCIAYLPPTSEREGYYLDGTADRNPVGYLRADDQGARVLHVSERGGELRDIPYAPPGQNALRRTYTIALKDDGSGDVALRDRSVGMRAVTTRYRYGGGTGGKEALLAEELNAGFGSVRIESIETSDLEDIRVPATLDARFGATDLWTPEGRTRTLPVGFDDLGLAGLASEPPVDRVYDVVLDRPYAQQTDVVWTLPEGATLSSLPPDVHISAEGLLDYRQTVEPVDGGLRVSRRFELLTRRVPLERYESFRDVLHQVEQAERRTVRVIPAGTPEESL